MWHISTHTGHGMIRSCWGTDDLDYPPLRRIAVHPNQRTRRLCPGPSKTFKATNDSSVSFVLDDCDIVFTGKGDVPPVTALYLDKIAARREKDRWRISAATLLSAIKGGENLAGIQAELASAASTPLTVQPNTSSGQSATCHLLCRGRPATLHRMQPGNTQANNDQ